MDKVLSEFKKIAPYLKHPLVLAGFVVFLLFLLLRTLLNSELLSAPGQWISGELLNKVLDYGFVLALLAILLGFALAFYRARNAGLERPTKKAIRAIERLYKYRLKKVESENDGLKQELAAAKQAVRDLADEAMTGGDTARIKEALERIGEDGDTRLAEAILDEDIVRLRRLALEKETERTQLLAEAARASRNKGALAVGKNTETALEAYRLATELEPGNPENWHWRGELAQDFGCLDEAHDAFSRLLDATLKEANTSPGNLAKQRDLSVSYNNIADVLTAQGKLDLALDSFRKALAIRTTLAAQDPSNSQWQRDLSVSHDRIADVLTAQGQLDLALDGFRKALAIRTTLATQDPSNSQRQRDLSVSHIKISDVLEAQNKLNLALDSFHEALGIAKTLAAQDPSNSQWQRDLSVSHERVGDVLKAQGKLDLALESFRVALAIRTTLAAQDPSNAIWQTDLVLMNWRLSRTTEDKAQAATWLRDGLRILRSLAEQERLTPEQLEWIDKMETELAGLD